MKLFMDFLTDYTHLFLFVMAVASGLMLLWPTLLRRHHVLSVSDAVQLINRRQAVIIDLRDSYDYAQGHIPNSQHLTLEALQARPDATAKNKKAPLLLICDKGDVSHKARRILVRAGYEEIFILRHGLRSWRRENMPMVIQKKSR
jgi:rhodanese-related sulfurtransferase